jgi:rod shape-determining protein MreD
MNGVWAFLQACWIVLLLLGIGLLIQNDLGARLAILGVQPDLLLGALVLLARRTGPMTGLLVGFAAGLMQDGLTPDHVGFNAWLLMTAGYVCGHLKESIFWESQLASGLIVFLAALAHNILQAAVASDFSASATLGLSLHSGLPSALYTSVFVTLLAWAVPRVIRGRE